MSHNCDSVQNNLLFIPLSYFFFVVGYSILFAEVFCKVYGIEYS